ncbi:hypothetical protein COE15_01180 [Bacillus cereus]|uniref:ParB N-terminal domain-containing protein n=1 Tax=Bacillus sp. AFS023182 TaxID=2033492 RepID=UPI000BF295A0|nr:ParB N-terminal domain-containing protein [Bacillus sp. AFS023182]PFD95628.1 hypothetical protein CN288_26180 [Bacillus sp. AFS023182]PGY05353.1 hypothetical protein COE15_01180 [Bacillus cereus]
MLSELRVVPTDQVFLHEEYEIERLYKLSHKIKSEQKLKNPPIALQLDNNKYLILDGAHRTLSLRKLNCKRMVVQVVTAEYLSINAWAHHILNGKKLIEELKVNQKICLSDERQNDIPMATLYYEGKEQYLYIVPEHQLTLENKVNVWKEVVNSYTNKYEFNRIMSNQTIQDAGLVFNYTTLDLYQIKQIVDSNLLLPAGVTKFTLNCGRILNLNIPLSFLIREDFVQEDWEELLELWESSIRLYTDPVLLCEI